MHKHNINYIMSKLKFNHLFQIFYTLELFTSIYFIVKIEWISTILVSTINKFVKKKPDLKLLCTSKNGVQTNNKYN